MNTYFQNFGLVLLKQFNSCGEARNEQQLFFNVPFLRPRECIIYLLIEILAASCDDTALRTKRKQDRHPVYAFNLLIHLYNDGLKEPHCSNQFLLRFHDFPDVLIGMRCFIEPATEQGNPAGF